MPAQAVRRQYDHRLRDLVRRTRDAELFPALQIPPSTARMWIVRGPREVVSSEHFSCDEQDLLAQIARLESRIAVLRAVVILLVALVRAFGMRGRLGLAFVDEIERVLGLALQFPESGTLVPQRRVRREIRLFRLNPDFPYDIVATVIDEEDLLLVLAVAHHSRRPRYWISRVAQTNR